MGPREPVAHQCLILRARQETCDVQPHFAVEARERQKTCSSAERERERFHAGIEELDLELSIGDRSRLSNQLIQALLGDRAVALVVDVTSMACARRLSIDQHSKRNGSSASRLVP